MPRSSRPLITLCRDDDGFALRVGQVTLSGFLGRHPRAARRHLRAILRSWGWPGREIRYACAWLNADGRTGCLLWPKRAPVLQ